MISRTTIGRSFAGLVRYQFEGRKDLPSDKQAEVLAAVGVRADSAAHMSTDFNRGRQLNPNLGQAVWHTSLSFNPDDAVKLDSAKMLAIAEGYVQKMGLGKTQYAIIRHHDQPDNQHLHIIANRVGDDGQTIKDGQNFYRSKKVLTELIQEHGLTAPKGLRPEKQHAAQLHGVDRTRHELKEALRTALATTYDGKELRQVLQEQVITFKVFQTKEGKPTGISFAKDGQTLKGSEIGREYSLAGIVKQLEANQATRQAEASRQEAAQRRAEQDRQQAAAQVEAQRQAVAQAVKVPELPAIERKWQADFHTYTTGIAQQNAQVRAHNKVVDSYSEYLKAHPNSEGVEAVVEAMGAATGMGRLKAELERQAKNLANHEWNVAHTYGQQKDLEKQAGGLLGFGLGAKAKEAKEKLAILEAKGRYIPDDKNRMFAIYTAEAAKPAPVPVFEARAYHQPVLMGLSLAAYAAKREAEKQLVVRVIEPVSEINTTGRADALQRTLTSKGAAVSMSHTVDAQGNRVSEVVVQYSLQQPRSEVKGISFVLDWAAKQHGHELKERDADKAQRQAPGQRDAQAQQAQTRTRDRSQGLGLGGR